MSRKTYNLNGFEEWLAEHYRCEVGLANSTSECPISSFIMNRRQVKVDVQTNRTTIKVNGIIYGLPKQARRFIAYIDNYFAHESISGKEALRAWGRT